MKKWTGGVLILGLALVLIISYSFVGKPPQKQSAYDFFHTHPPKEDHPEGHGSQKNVESSEIDVIKLSPFKKKPTLVDYEGLSLLYNLKNFCKEEECKALGVWARMRPIISRSDALPETSQGIKEAAAAWKELLSVIGESKASKIGDSGKEKDCPYHVIALNGDTGTGNITGSSSTLQIPCGLVKDSSITVIGIPDAKDGSFQIELLGSRLQDEPLAPIVLRYHVFLPGENLTKDPFIVQNSWTNQSGWGKEERCPDRGLNNFIKVDGLTKCNTQNIRDAMEDNLNASNPSGDKLTNVSNGEAHASANFPFAESIPFTASLWTGVEGFHMTVNGRHETSFAYREKLDPWLVSDVKLKGGLDIISIVAKGLPTTKDLSIDIDIGLLRAPPLSRKRLELLIGVFSTANNFDRRMALRRSWMQYKAVRKGDVAVRFFIGLYKNGQVNLKLWREAEAYGDIQMMPFVDYYSLLTLKTIAICILGIEILPAKYIMKTDDDAFVRIDEVLASLKEKASNGLVYGQISFESGPHRDKENKWYISPEEWPHSSYPPWPHGPGYIITRDVAKYIVQGHQQRDLMLFKLEDVALGIWVEQFKRDDHKVEYISDDRFNIAGCESNYILAHYQSPRNILCLWEKLQKDHEPECCE